MKKSSIVRPITSALVKSIVESIDKRLDRMIFDREIVSGETHIHPEDAIGGFDVEALAGENSWLSLRSTLYEDRTETWVILQKHTMTKYKHGETFAISQDILHPVRTISEGIDIIRNMRQIMDNGGSYVAAIKQYRLGN